MAGSTWDVAWSLRLLLRYAKYCLARIRRCTTANGTRFENFREGKAYGFRLARCRQSTSTSRTDVFGGQVVGRLWRTSTGAASFRRCSDCCLPSSSRLASGPSSPPTGSLFLSRSVYQRLPHTAATEPPVAVTIPN